VVSGEWELIRVRHLYWAIAFGVLVGFSWYFSAMVSDFDRFWSSYVVRETLQKSSGNESSAFRMWIAFFYQSLPIVVIFLFGFRSLWRRRRTSLLLMFTVCYAWPFILFFSIFPYRVNNYLFVLTPVLAVWVDWVLSHERKVKTIRMGLALSQVLLILVGCFFFLILSFWFRTFSVWQNLAWLTLILIGVVSLYRESIRGFLALSLGTIFCSLFLVAEISDYGYGGLRTYIRNNPAANLVMFDSSKDIWHEVGLVSLAVGKPIERAVSYEQIIEALRQKKSVILSDQQKEDFKNQILLDLGRVNEPHVLREIPWTRWGRRKNISWKEVFAERDPTQFKNLLSRDYWIISLSD
jgi:4-amino-4-deoxy-L-arabinose transferase-like glycosyltransferase